MFFVAALTAKSYNVEALLNDLDCPWSSDVNEFMIQLELRFSVDLFLALLANNAENAGFNVSKTACRKTRDDEQIPFNSSQSVSKKPLGSSPHCYDALFVRRTNFVFCRQVGKITCLSCVNSLIRSFFSFCSARQVRKPLNYNVFPRKQAVPGIRKIPNKHRRVLSWQKYANDDTL